MKYIDGKDNQINWFKYPFGVVVKAYIKYVGNEPIQHKSGGVKHKIPITYYKPLTICFKDDMKTYFLPELEDFDNLEWIDGQPYELIMLGKD